ncbi:hypothetical protein R69746_06957 [Paraburkholderia aspalathi]|uniref:GPW/gp25 family protein n=1 Tax=Paraburkholderia aspalathi TaxID=1324617 RepID=UPI00190B3834|nr:GPW/gp25 family protein [Paraburkholderia aspalathi]MBK3842957.1 baseplate assembly protein [Paraburkholderia aspalathi]CAE6841763.1 hypothetical protein R69746_06957 [Paraburkholderia aspalathi]
MKGMNTTTGRAIADLDHLYQSIGKILSTPRTSCIKRRTFGSDVFACVDAANNGTTRTRLYAAVATALMRWEPRLTLTRVQLTVDESVFDGATFLDIEGFTAESGAAVRTGVPLISGNVA